MDNLYGPKGNLSEYEVTGETMSSASLSSRFAGQHFGSAIASVHVAWPFVCTSGLTAWASDQPHAGTSYAPEGKVLDASTAAEVAFPADLPCLLQVCLAAI